MSDSELGRTASTMLRMVPLPLRVRRTGSLCEHIPVIFTNASGIPAQMHETGVRDTAVALRRGHRA